MSITVFDGSRNHLDITNPYDVVRVADEGQFSLFVSLLRIIRFCFRTITLLMLLIFVLSLLYKLPDEISEKVKDMDHFLDEIRDQCFQDYLVFSCNITEAPALKDKCEELYRCYTSSKRASEYVFILDAIKLSFFKFFSTLSVRSTLSLGFISGLIVFSIFG